MSKITVTYSHAAPYIREALCRAVYSAHCAKTQRDMRAHLKAAHAYAHALSIMAASGDQTPVPGIAGEEGLPPSAVLWARVFLGDDADKILGEASS